MGEVGATFKRWVLEQEVEGVSCQEETDGSISLDGAHAKGTIAYYCFEDAPVICEMRVSDERDQDQLFFLHFELVDIDRARELFGEMCDVIVGRGACVTRRVLLCCTAGFTTTLFASKLQEAARALSLDYEFLALPLEEIEGAGDVDAVMLAPQVAYRRREVAEAFPDACVFEIPAKVFGSSDAGGALRMLCGLLGDDALSTPDATDLRVVRDMKNDYMVLLISVVRHPSSWTLSWRLFDRFRLVAADRVHKCTFRFHDLEDVLSCLRMRDIRVQDIDAVGIALPGAVDYGRVFFVGDEFDGMEVERRLHDRFGVAVFVDNNANAGAAGCYVSQETYDSVVLHTQQTGSFVGGQGTIANGRLLRGRAGMAGELGAFAQRVFIDGCLYLPELAGVDGRDIKMVDATDVCWRADAMLPILATTLLANIVVCAPDAIFVSYDLIDDMDALRKELAKTLDEDLIPDLIHIDDYHEKIFAGEMALVLQRLNTSAS